MASDTQTNTRQGPIQVLASETLTGLEGRLVKIISDSGTPKAALPDAVTDLALYILVAGAAAGSLVTLQPLEPGQQARVRLNGTVAPGARVKLAAINATDDGKIATIGTAAGVYFSPGIAEETGADEQLTLIRPDPCIVTVAGAHVSDASTAHALNATFSDTEVEAALNALGTKINSVISALETAGILASA